MTLPSKLFGIRLKAARRRRHSLNCGPCAKYRAARALVAAPCEFCRSHRSPFRGRAREKTRRGVRSRCGAVPCELRRSRVAISGPCARNLRSALALRVRVRAVGENSCPPSASTAGSSTSSSDAIVPVVIRAPSTSSSVGNISIAARTSSSAPRTSRSPPKMGADLVRVLALLVRVGALLVRVVAVAVRGVEAFIRAVALPARVVAVLCY